MKGCTIECKALHCAQTQHLLLLRCSDGLLTMCALPWLRQWTHHRRIHSRQPALKLRPTEGHNCLQ